MFSYKQTSFTETPLQKFVFWEDKLYHSQSDIKKDFFFGLVTAEMGS